MTITSRVISMVPPFLIAAITSSAMWLLHAPSLSRLLLLLFVIYLLPLLIYRLHNFVSPLQHGVSDLAAPCYSSWWGGHQIQILYAVFPVFERVLRVIPGAYSMWLRAWGSSIGRGVYWTPQVEIHDRGSMVIGDGVVFGHKVECYGHVIKPRGDRLMLYCERVIIGSGTFVGAGVRMGPGTKVGENCFIPLLHELRINERLDQKQGEEMRSTRSDREVSRSHTT